MKLLRCADSGVLVELGDLDEVLALYEVLAEAPPPGVTELVPAARTLLLRFAPPGTGGHPGAAGGRSRTTGGPAGDPGRQTGDGTAEAVAEAVGWAWERARERVGTAASRHRPDTEPVQVPVVYDGPDLTTVGEITGLGAAGVVAAHTERDWTVAFCGFAPGFGYLVGGDPRLRVPRRASSRTRVTAGAVGLAGEFSGVYPRESPGGWQLIGRTSLRVFDLDRDPPALLRPGVRIRFTQAA